jgi:hypothetical protein
MRDDIGPNAEERLDALRQVDEAHPDGGVDFHQHVHVAVLALIAPSVRTEEGQPRDSEFPCELRPCRSKKVQDVLRGLHDAFQDT